MAAPVASFAVYGPMMGAMAAIVPGSVFVAFLFLASEIVRGRGRALQARLVREWDGLPTLKALRLRSNAADPRVRRRRQGTEKVTGLHLPTATDEERDPAAADHEYGSVIAAAIARIRASGMGGELLQRENTSYGFRRNTRSLRAFGLTASVTAVFLHLLIATAGESVPLSGAMAGGNLVLAAVWLLVVTDAWVLDQAEIYSERFFAALDSVLPRQR